jgi:Tfp pilus assembly protein PilZ
MDSLYPTDKGAGEVRKQAMSAEETNHIPIVVSFDSLEEFQKEYSQNIANGGIFVPSTEPLEMRDAVKVCLDLSFSGEVVEILGEVVSIVPGAYPGVAVQFTESASEIRSRLSHTAGIGSQREAGEDGSVDGGWRAAARYPIHICVHIKTKNKILIGQTVNLSRSGTLLVLEGNKVVKVGSKMDMILVQPIGGGELVVPGTVVRHVGIDGGRTAMGITFDWSDEECQVVTQFIEALEAGECSGKRADIQGHIGSVGLATVLQMLTSCSTSGTVVIRRSGEEGQVVFDDGKFLQVHLGDATGTEALNSLCAWRDGHFSYRTQIDLNSDKQDKPLSIDGAIFEAMAHIDEVGRTDTLTFSPSAKLTLAADLDTVSSIKGRVEEALIELAQATFEVGGVLDIIPESEEVIYATLSKLIEQGVIKLED